MKRAVLLVLLAAVLAGCDDFPIEGDDVFRGHGGGRGDDLVQQHQSGQAEAVLDR